MCLQQLPSRLYNESRNPFCKLIYMNIKNAYNIWANQYDTNQNQTRDLEAEALRAMLAGITIQRTLEIGCGTGKNTQWLQTISNLVIAVDLSEQMLAKAKEKITSDHVHFLQAV